MTISALWPTYLVVAELSLLLSRSYSLNPAFHSSRLVTRSLKQLAMPCNTDKKTQRVLSIQSHTVFGFVGNKAATFPLQTMGFNVDCINTVSLSNHPAYEQGTKGAALDAQDFSNIIQGLQSNRLLAYDAILTGYTRSKQHLDIIESTVKEIREHNPHAIYVCDPVLGDNGDFYVPSDLAETYKRSLLPLATIITPNMFESQVLSGVQINSLPDAIQAAKSIHSLGPKTVIMTGLDLRSPDSLTALVSSLSLEGEQVAYSVTFPRLTGYYAGCGDLFSALTVAGFCQVGDKVNSHPHLLGGLVEIAVDTMREVMLLTKSRGSRELCIVESRDVFIRALELMTRLLVPSYTSELETMAAGAQAQLVAGGRPLAVIFDMDRTLTEPGAIDFDAMYTRNGLQREPNADIVTLINRLPEAERQAALQVVYEEEMKGCEKMILRADLHALMTRIADGKIRCALSTRNCEDGVHAFLYKAKMGAHCFSPMVSRDTLGGINKPDPRVVQHILSEWEIAPDDAKHVWFVGDSRDDMICAKGAGCRTVLIACDHNHALRENKELVDVVVNGLDELQREMFL